MSGTVAGAVGFLLGVAATVALLWLIASSGA
jgi:hypothetical protein